MSIAKKELNLFSQFSLENPKTKKDSIIETINDDKHFILNFYANQPYYNEMMTKIKKADRGIVFYKGMIRKGLKHGSVFFQEIMKQISRINKRHESIISYLPKERKKIKFYKLPKIDELKIKINQIENIKKKKIRIINLEKEKYSEKFGNKIFPFTTVRRNSPLFSISSTFNFNNNRYTSSNNATNISFNKNGNLTDKENILILSPKNNDLSTNYRSNRSLKTISKSGFFNSKIRTFKNCNSTNDINNIMNKCKEEINRGKEVEELVLDYNKNFMKDIQSKIDSNKLINKDKQVIEDRNKTNKYVKLEEKNYKNIKKNMNKKISTSFAYKIRKELEEVLKVNENAESYLLHLNDVNNTNKRMEKRRIVGRKVIDKVNSLCDIGFQQKEYLKNRIDIINDKNLKINKSKDALIKDEFYFHNNNKNKITGKLVPKLIELKNKNENKVEVGTHLKI